MSIIAIAWLAALSPAPAQDRAETRAEIRVVNVGGEGPGRLDGDGDGVITREEFAAPVGDAFDRLDADRDGRLSAGELAAGHGGPDGPGPRVLMFGGPGDHADRDVRVIARGGPGGPGGPGMMIFGGPGGPGVQVFTARTGPDGGPMAPGSSQVFVRRFGGPDGPGAMDKDGDGKVSQDEFLTPLREAFARMDADRDGFLDEEEGRPTPPSVD
jgi:hypothetical protein